MQPYVINEAEMDLLVEQTGQILAELN